MGLRHQLSAASKRARSVSDWNAIRFISCQLLSFYLTFISIKIDFILPINFSFTMTTQYNLPLEQINNKDIKGIINSYLINPLEKLNKEFHERKLCFMNECCNCKQITTALEYCERCLERTCTVCIEYVNNQGHCHSCSVELYLNYLEMND